LQGKQAGEIEGGGAIATMSQKKGSRVGEERPYLVIVSLCTWEQWMTNPPAVESLKKLELN
jgi:hypothetical protein